MCAPCNVTQTVSPNVHTSMSSMARTNSGTGSFKRSRSGLADTPDGSGSPFKGGGPPSLTPSPVERPDGSPFKGGGGSGALRCNASRYGSSGLLSKTTVLAAHYKSNLLLLQRSESG